MTLLDAPKFDEAKERRRRVYLFAGAGTFAIAVIVFWIIAGFPIDYPWNWYAHLTGRNTINTFFKDIEKNDLAAAYGIWIHDPQWQQHPQNASYPFTRFQDDWSPNSPQNDYGAIKSHELAAARINGNVLIMGVFINHLHSKPLFLSYDPKTRQLGFSPVELYLGP